jgi:hypothetical protein
VCHDLEIIVSLGDSGKLRKTSISLVNKTGEILSTFVLNFYQQGHCYANTLRYNNNMAFRTQIL